MVCTFGCTGKSQIPAGGQHSKRSYRVLSRFCPESTPPPTNLKTRVLARQGLILVENVKHRRLRGSLGATLNREIGFVSSSFSFRAWRACERARRSCGCVRGAECSSWAGLGCGELSSCSRPLCESQDVVYAWVLSQNGSKSVPGSRSLPVFYVGFMKVLHKTRVYGMGFMANPFKTHVWCISYRKNLIKTRVQHSL